jgi:hypothetical protein
MIAGDPYKFAIITEFIPNWNLNNSWHNGVILFSINGNLLFNEIRTSTLDVDLYEFINNIKRLDADLPINTLIYEMEKYSAFIEMYNTSFPSDINIPNNYTYRISTSILEDDNYYIFAVASRNSIRILGAKLKNPSMECDKIVEVTFSRSYLSHFLKELLGLVKKMKCYGC